MSITVLIPPPPAAPREPEHDGASVPAPLVTATLPVTVEGERFAGRKRFTRAACDFLERMGYLPHRYELIDGEIFEKVGQSRPHIIGVSRITAWTIGVFGGEYVQCQGDMEVAAEDQTSNLPQPDIAVTRELNFTYATAPTGVHVRVLWEVSDSTLRDNLTTKAELYARAGVPEYVVQDVRGRRLIVHRAPQDGAYTTLQLLEEADTLTLDAAPNHPAPVANLLPPATLGQVT